MGHTGRHFETVARQEDPMNGRRGFGEVWLVILIVLLIVGGVAALGVALFDHRDAGEQAAEDRPTPT
jgi:flagellar basal body-associated protein FliL